MPKYIYGIDNVLIRLIQYFLPHRDWRDFKKWVFRGSTFLWEFSLRTNFINIWTNVFEQRLKIFSILTRFDDKDGFYEAGQVQAENIFRSDRSSCSHRHSGDPQGRFWAFISFWWHRFSDDWWIMNDHWWLMVTDDQWLMAIDWWLMADAWKLIND